MKYISRYKHALGISLGIVAAIAVLFSQSCYYNYVALEKSKVNTEVPGADGEEHHDVLTISKDAVTSAVQFTISQVLHLIGNIDLQNSDEVEVELEQTTDFNTYFRTLFRLIIAPNAP